MEMEIQGEVNTKRKRTHAASSTHDAGDTHDDAIDNHSGEDGDGDAIDLSKYKFTKHAPHHEPAKPYDVFIGGNSVKSSVLARCRELLISKKYPFIHLHALGAAIELCVEIAVQLNAESGGVWKLGPSTSTVALVDTYEPMGGDKGDMDSSINQIRFNSALNVKVFCGAGDGDGDGEKSMMADADAVVGTDVSAAWVFGRDGRKGRGRKR